MNSPYLCAAFVPVGWRVHWQEQAPHGVQPRRGCRDFPTEGEAIAFKAALQAHQPQSVVCIEARHLSRAKRNAKNDARQLSAAMGWPLQNAPPKPMAPARKAAKP